MKKKMPLIGIGTLLASGFYCTSALGVVTFLKEDFQTQTAPVFNAPQVGSTIATTGTTDLANLSISTYPDPAQPSSTGGKSVKIRREQAGDQTVLALYGNAGAMVAGNTLEYTFDVYQEGLAFNSPQQFSLGLSNGGVGRLLFFGVNDLTGKDRNYFYQTFGSQIALDRKPTGQLPGETAGWDRFRMVFTLGVETGLEDYMTGSFDLFLTRDVNNVNTPETLPVEEQLANDVHLGYGQIPLEDDANTPYNDITAPLFRVSRGPEISAGPMYLDNISITGNGTDNLGADANADGRVNTLDFNILAGHFGFAGQTFADGDFDGNGSVGSEDFNILVANWGRAAAPGPTLGAVVPEPASIGLIAAGLALVTRRRKA